MRMINENSNYQTKRGKGKKGLGIIRRVWRSGWCL